MKKAIFSIAFICICAFITILSCKKNNYNSSVNPVTPSLNQVFAGLRYTPQSLNVTAGRDTVVYGANGTTLHFYNNSFKNVSGAIITSGTVNLQLIEMYKPGDMICNRATTLASGQILQSAGQVSIVATMNGQTVYANAYGIGFKHSTSSTATMGLFYGGTGNADSIATWTQADSTRQGVLIAGTSTDSTSPGSGISSGVNSFYFDTCTNFTWANCDWFYFTDSSKTTVGVILPDTSFNPHNTQMFLVLPNVNRWGSTADTFNAVLSSDGGYGGNDYVAATNTLSILSENEVNIVPAGMNYELVVITNKNGSYYYWETSGVVPHTGINVKATLTPETEGDVIARLQGL